MTETPPTSRPSGAEVGRRVVHRRYVPYAHAHYAGNLVDGAYSLGLFGDVATEMCIVTDGDEGLFASYDDVQFLAPVRAGDVLEISCELTRVGTRSRQLSFAVHVVAGAQPPPSARVRRRSSSRRSWRPRPRAPSSCRADLPASPPLRDRGSACRRRHAAAGEIFPSISGPPPPP